MRTLSIIALICLLLTVFLAGCNAQKIADVKTEEAIGSTVTLKGTVTQTLKVGKLSGYILTDDAGDTIGIASESLPAEGDKITVKGVVVKDSLLGYYIVPK